MASLALLVESAPDATDYRSELALAYAKAAVAAEHHLRMVFFYGAGVLHGKAADHPATQAWCEFAEQHDIPLMMCATVAEQVYALDLNALPSAFQSGGLTEFAMTAAETDQVVQFK